jgi:hypothetical protein
VIQLDSSNPHICISRRIEPQLGSTVEKKQYKNEHLRNKIKKHFVNSQSTHLAIFLETLRLFALASHVVIFLYAILKGLWVLGPCVLHGLVTDRHRFCRILTVGTIASITKAFRRETVAIQFQATRLFAVAGSSFARSFLAVLLFSRRLILFFWRTLVRIHALV